MKEQLTIAQVWYNEDNITLGREITDSVLFLLWQRRHSFKNGSMVQWICERSVVPPPPLSHTENLMDRKLKNFFDSMSTDKTQVLYFLVNIVVLVDLVKE